MTTTSFGRRGLPGSAPTPSWTPLQAPPPSAPLGVPKVSFLERMFLWIPDERAPGIPALGLALMRQAFLPFILAIVPIVITTVVGLLFIARLPRAQQAPFLDASGGALIACQVLILELNRYAFVRRADDPAKGLLLITGVQIAVGLLISHAWLYTMAWQLAVQLAAAGALYLGLRVRRRIGVIILMIVLGHTVVDIAARRLEPPKAASAPPAPPQTAETVTVPDVGDMKTWAKLYPGSVVTRATTTSLLGLTDWQVSYTTPATPDQVTAFYRSAAADVGFTQTETLLGLQMYTRPNTNSRFTVLALKTSNGTLVSYDARAMAAK